MLDYKKPPSSTRTILHIFDNSIHRIVAGSREKSISCRLYTNTLLGIGHPFVTLIN